MFSSFQCGYKEDACMFFFGYKTCHFNWNKWESLWNKVTFVASQSITLWPSLNFVTDKYIRSTK